MRLHTCTHLNFELLANPVAQFKILCDGEVQLPMLIEQLLVVEEFGTVGMLKKLLRVILGRLLGDCNNGELGERNAAIGAVRSEHPSV